jgi:hypothetical protein
MTTIFLVFVRRDLLRVHGDEMPARTHIQEIDKGRYDVCQPPNRECLSRFGWHTGEILPSRLI